MSKFDESNCLRQIKVNFFNRPHMGADDFSLSYISGDRNEIAEFLNDAKPNEESTIFPDFIFSGGFIEHFEVTSSQESKKGSMHRRKVAEHTRYFDTHRVTDASRIDYIPNTVTTISYQMESPPYDIEKLRQSIRARWNEHLASLDKYNGVKDCGVFMLELSGATPYCEMANGGTKNYGINLDYEILQFIYENRSTLKYVMYKGGTDYQIIFINDIPKILSTIDKNIKWEMGRCLVNSCEFIIDI